MWVTSGKPPAMLIFNLKMWHELICKLISQGGLTRCDQMQWETSVNLECVHPAAVLGNFTRRDDNYRSDHEHIGLHLNNRLSRVPGNSLIKMGAGIRVKIQVINVPVNVNALCDNTDPDNLNEWICLLFSLLTQITLYHIRPWVFTGCCWVYKTGLWTALLPCYNDKNWCRPFKYWINSKLNFLAAQATPRITCN